MRLDATHRARRSSVKHLLHARATKPRSVDNADYGAGAPEVKESG
jgi:hypothetical protein